MKREPRSHESLVTLHIRRTFRFRCEAKYYPETPSSATSMCSRSRGPAAELAQRPCRVFACVRESSSSRRVDRCLLTRRRHHANGAASPDAIPLAKASPGSGASGSLFIWFATPRVSPFADRDFIFEV